MADWIACAAPEIRQTFLDELSDAELRALPYLFEFWALPHQLPPDGNWRTWIILGGRGAGKTRAGAEWVRSQVEGAQPLDPGRARRVALIGETYDQVRDVMIHGDSGILACSPPDRRPHWKVTERKLIWPNGAEAQAFSAQEPESLRGPQFDAAWADELGCAAIDKGTNQPNKFIDPKSAESSLPYYSNGQRDDFMQVQYLKAMLGHWSDPARNPVSSEYGGPMVDLSNAYVWAWDARPYPAFPNNRELWGDGENHGRGHWLNGRTGARTLASVVEEICLRAGVTDIDTSRLYGLVRGYLVDEVSDGRSAIQPLMLRFGFDAIERDGTLVFRHRDGLLTDRLDSGELALSPDLDGRVEQMRAAEAEMSGRVRLRFLEAGSDYGVTAEEAVLPDEETHAVSVNEVPLVMTRAEGRQTVERWLTEARVARDSVRFALPPSRLLLGAGDVVELPGDGGEGAARFRIDRVEQTDLQMIEAVRVEPSVYLPSEMEEDAGTQSAFVPPVPVLPLFLDLPLMRGDEVPHAPHIAVSARPWPGSVAVYASEADASYVLSDIVTSRAIMGLTETPLQAARPGLWDRGAPLQVKLFSGGLEARSVAEVLSGANVAAIGDGTPGGWELFQFASAEVIAPDTYWLSDRLRGQLGTEAAMPAAWPAGSWFVLMNGVPSQIDLASSLRGVARHYRIGPAQRAVDDPSYRHVVEAFDGVGLRPYAPVHLRAHRQAGGRLDLSWIRRTRIDGDRWDGTDVPLGEEAESYLVRIRRGASVLRTVTTAEPAWSYSVADQAADGAQPDDSIEVAQISARFGPGPFAAAPIPV